MNDIQQLQQYVKNQLLQFSLLQCFYSINILKQLFYGTQIVRKHLDHNSIYDLYIIRLLYQQMNIRKNLKLNTNISSQSEEDCKSLGSSGHDLNDHYEQFIIDNQVYAEVSTRKCGRNIMEDRFCAIPNYDGQMKQFFYAVYDGHGGTHVAKLLQQRLHQAIRQHQQFKQDLEVAILETFHQVNSNILEFQNQKQKDGGSTALLAINCDKQLYCINLGDSTCVHIARDNVEKLNREHKPSIPDEAERIRQNLGHVIYLKNTARINGELSVSRSFGDPKYVPFGLTAVPEITKTTIDENSQYLIMATDGFWDLVNLVELQQLIKDYNEEDELSQLCRQQEHIIQKRQYDFIDY
ncbi:hypothetical protein pb186bvf_002044 [Paramecium bursaria]